MHFEYLATELVCHIYTSCGSITDVLALSATCRRYRDIFSKRRLTILAAAAEHQYGPLHDSMQLLTHNSAQPAHVVRTVAINLALLKQMVEVGKVAEKWVEMYPFKRWKHDFEDRRSLSPHEKYRIRRAVYRIWLYGLAFHNRQHSRETRLLKLVVQERSRLLHNWSTAELVEMADVRRVMRDVVADNVCPSNGTIARKWRKRFPDDANPHSLMFNIHLNYPPPNNGRPVSGYHNPYSYAAAGATDDRYYQHRQPRSTYAWSKYQSTRFHDPGSEGWGDDIAHYYVVEDMLKLNPSQIVFLKENVKFKREVETWTRCFAAGAVVPSSPATTLEQAMAGMALGGVGLDYCMGDWAWFDNNGETWSETLRTVLEERGLEVSEVLGQNGAGYGGAWGIIEEDED